MCSVSLWSNRTSFKIEVESPWPHLFPVDEKESDCVDEKDAGWFSFAWLDTGSSAFAVKPQ
jgi:hypothetical protein